MRTLVATGVDHGREASIRVGPAAEEFLKLLARAFQHVHTYPAASPLRADAIAACHAALGRVPVSERLLFVVEPRELRLGETRVGAGMVVGQEIARRLHDARVSVVEIDHAASVRDLTRFCEDAVAAKGSDETVTLAESLVEHGVDRVSVTMSHRPEVLNIGAPPPVRSRVLAEQRRRRESASIEAGPSIHLYPPDSGWIRTDPAVDLGSVTLPDLAVLVDDPSTLAMMLQRLADDDPGGPATTPASALERKFSDVTKLFGALEPQLARTMFSKLARAVLALDANRRRSLLQRTVLPGLLDGEPDGAVLQEFPDVDLASALALLLDVETAAPELLATALDRLALPAERREVMATLLEEQMTARLTEGPAGERRASPLDERTKQLIRVSAADSRSFTEFWAYDLAIDAETQEAMAAVASAIRTTDPLAARLDCAFHLVRFEPNPVAVERLLDSMRHMLGDLERGEQWKDVDTALVRLAHLATELRTPRPDVAEAISAALGVFFDEARVMRLLMRYEAGGAEGVSVAEVVRAVGQGLAASLFERLRGTERHTHARMLAQLMCDHAPLLAPGLVTYLGEGTPLATAVVVRVMGCAGSGYEDVIASQLGHSDETVVREALRALARIGTPSAAAAVGAVVRQRGTKAQALAEEALWHFPPEGARTQLLELLQHREFVRASPKTVIRMLDRACRSGTHGLDTALTTLVPLRFRFWNPSLRRVGTRARSLLQQP